MIANKKTRVFISGGAAHGTGMGKSLSIVLSRLTTSPLEYVGVSIGAYLGLLAAVEGRKCSKDAVDSLWVLSGRINPQKAFKFIPVNGKGKFKLRALWRAARDKPPAIQDSTFLVRDYISEDEWLEWKSLPNSPNAFGGAVDFATGKRVYFDFKNDPKDYNELVDMVEACMRMQIMTEPQVIRGRKYWDLGNKDHNGGLTFLMNNPHTDTVISINSRPKTFLPTPLSQSQSGFFTNLNRALELYNIETSNNDLMLESEMCKGFEGDMGVLWREYGELLKYSSEDVFKDAIKSIKANYLPIYLPRLPHFYNMEASTLYEHRVKCIQATKNQLDDYEKEEKNFA